MLRVWMERETANIRARILHERKLGSGERYSVAASSVDEIVDIVTRWLASFVDDDP